MLKKIKIWTTWLLVCLVWISVPKTIVFAANDTEATYSKPYTIENLLSDYQYVSKTDLTVANHTVGAIVCGGNATVSDFGDGAIAPSYFHNIVANGNYAAGSYFTGSSEYGGYVGMPAYYKTAASGASTSTLTQYTGTGEYIDFNSAFTNILSESNSLATAPDAYIATQSDITGDQYSGYTLKLPLVSSKNIVIPKAIYDQVNYLQLCDIPNANDVHTYQYTISVVGITDKEPINMTFGYISPSDSISKNITGILVPDGETFNNSNSLKSVLSGGIEAGQMNMDGMKLVWNFPDATSVTTDYTGGHIVAPSATVTVNPGAGNFEGGIIANKIVDTSAEGHFYPYNSVSTTDSSSSSSSSSESSSSSSSSSESSSSSSSSSESSSSSSSSSESSSSSSSSSESSSSSSSSSESSSSSSSSSDSSSSSSSSSESSSSSSSSSESSLSDSSSSEVTSGDNLSNKESSTQGPNSTPTQTDGVPKTGDSTPPAWPFILAIISGAGILYFDRKKKADR